MNAQKINRSEVFAQAWQFVKRLGFSMSEALKAAWLYVKTKRALKKGIVHFYFKKIDGTIREAYGTLNEAYLPYHAESTRRTNDTVQTYFDTEKGEYRCFKRANLLAI